MKLLDFSTNNQSKILVWKIEEDSDYFLNRLRLTEYDQQELAKFLIEKRKLQWYASRHTLKQVLGTDEIVDLQKDALGKPFINGSDLHLSLSHTHALTAAMVNNNCKVGIDIEQIKEKILRVADKFCTTEERLGMTVENEIAYLITLWSAKESLYKLYGNKQLDFREHIRLEPFVFSTQGQIKACIQKHSFEKHLTVQYQLLEDHVLTYVEDVV